MPPMLRYSRAKLATLSLICASTVCFLLVLFASHGFASPTLVIFIFSGTIGHFVVAPLFILIMTVATLGTGRLALGSLDAVVVDRRAIKVRTLWRSHSIDWLELREIALVARKFRNQTSHEIRFYRHSAGTVSLALDTLTLPERDYESACHRLVLAHREAIGQARKARQSVAPPVPRNAAPTFGRKRA